MFVILFGALLTTTSARDIGMRSVPGVRDSIINLGKMDVSFYMNGKSDLIHKNYDSSEFLKPCPCSHGNGMEDALQFFDKVIDSHEHHQQPTLSTKCCEPKVHEDIIFTFMPKKYPRLTNRDQSIPFPLNLLMNPANLKLQGIPEKDKAVEVILFPKRKDVENEKTTKTNQDLKEKIGGDEERNLKKIDSMPPVPLVANNLDENTDKGKDVDTKKKGRDIV